MCEFKDVIKDSQNYEKRHLLLGNGFSIACQKNIFTYKSLFESANFSNSPFAQQVFEGEKTEDFERVIKMLEDASRVVAIYGGDKAKALREQLADDADVVKNTLIETIAKHHPDEPNNIGENKFKSCRCFLENFLGRDGPAGNVYTLNYDLLLYWALLREEDSIKLTYKDSFARNGGHGPLKWKSQSDEGQHHIHYLHGALHLFESGGKTRKHSWKGTGKPLKDQARTAIKAGKFPLFVAEGESRQKLAKIQSSAYLRHSYDSFSRQMKKAEDCLFIFGHSLADNDQHILKKIGSGKIGKIYVGLHGDTNSEDYERTQRAAYGLAGCQRVAFFDAASANVWGTR